MGYLLKSLVDSANITARFANHENDGARNRREPGSVGFLTYLPV